MSCSADAKPPPAQRSPGSNNARRQERRDNHSQPARENLVKNETVMETGAAEAVSPTASADHNGSGSRSHAPAEPKASGEKKRSRSHVEDKRFKIFSGSANRVLAA